MVLSDMTSPVTLTSPSRSTQPIEQSHLGLEPDLDSEDFSDEKAEEADEDHGDATESRPVEMRNSGRREDVKPKKTWLAIVYETILDETSVVKPSLTYNEMYRSIINHYPYYADDSRLIALRGGVKWALTKYENIFL